MEPPPQLALEPLQYHLDMVRHLRAEESDLWKWFSTERVRQEQHEAVRFDLLKTTYRVERDANSALYAAADEAAAPLGLNMPVTFYQSQNAAGLNASLAYIPGEAHIVFTGPVASTLSPVEVRGVLGHELLHWALLDRWGDYLIAVQLLAAMANDAAAQPAHLNSARLFKLYTEVYCDRGSYKVTGDLGAAVGALVKIETGTADISAESYLRQAGEIFAKGHPRSEGVTHPETFIRAKALELWVQEPDTAAGQIQQVIEGPPTLDGLDLLGQIKVAGLTRRLVGVFLRPAWLRTDPMLAHARLFFPEFQATAGPDEALVDDLKNDDKRLHDYYCYILLDFATADRELEEAPLAAAFLLSDSLGLGERFRQLGSKELNLRKKQLQTLEADAARIVAQAQEAAD